MIQCTARRRVRRVAVVDAGTGDCVEVPGPDLVENLYFDAEALRHPEGVTDRFRTINSGENEMDVLGPDPLEFVCESASTTA